MVHLLDISCIVQWHQQWPIVCFRPQNTLLPLTRHAAIPTDTRVGAVDLCPVLARCDGKGGEDWTASEIWRCFFFYCVQTMWPFQEDDKQK